MRKPARFKKPLVWLAAARILLGIAALPLAPFLYKDNFLILVLLRPTKEVLLAAGFLARRGSVNLIQVVAAAVPLMILSVWHFYYLGRFHSGQIKSGNMPGIEKRILPGEKIRKLEKVLGKKGTRVVFLGRLAAFPSTLVGAAAGASEMPSRRFFPADGLGALLSIVEVVGTGYLLGHAYDKSKPWLTLVGVVILGVLLVLLGRYLRKEE